MPRSAKKSTQADKEKKNKTCTWCHKTKPLTDFYISTSPMFSLDHRIPFCKDCCKNYPLNDDGSINYLRFKELLMKMDKPLYYDVLQSAEINTRKEHPRATDGELEQYGIDILGRYYKQIAMKQTVDKVYTDSVKDNFINSAKYKTVKEKNELNRKYGSRFNTEDVEMDDNPIGIVIDGFEITKDIIDMFGEGYTAQQYKKMYEKYQNLKQNYQIQTSLHQEALITYVRFKVKEEMATAEGNVDEAKKWYDAAQNAADKAKLSPKQLTKADLQKGLNSFSEISQALEQAVDIIDILPRYKEQPNDSVDFNIWCYINYARRLKGLPSVDYKDVYEFYDDMKEEYLSQYGDPYGIFQNDMTVKNRDNIQKFITLPSDYDEIDTSEMEEEE